MLYQIPFNEKYISTSRCLKVSTYIAIRDMLFFFIFYLSMKTSIDFLHISSLLICCQGFSIFSCELMVIFTLYFAIVYLLQLWYFLCISKRKSFPLMCIILQQLPSETLYSDSPLTIVWVKRSIIVLLIKQHSITNQYPYS